MQSIRDQRQRLHVEKEIGSTYLANHLVQIDLRPEAKGHLSGAEGASRVGRVAYAGDLMTKPPQNAVEMNSLAFIELDCVAKYDFHSVPSDARELPCVRDAEHGVSH